MFQIKIRDAKPLFAVSTLLIPWDVFVYGNDLGWGITFALVRFTNASVGFGPEYQTIPYLLGLRSLISRGELIAIYVWIALGVLATLTAAYVVLARVLNGTTRPWEDRAVGAAFVGIGLLFIVSRASMYEYLLVSPQTYTHWFSIPFGAVYVVFVGYVFYRGRFRLGAPD